MKNFWRELKLRVMKWRPLDLNDLKSITKEMNHQKTKHAKNEL